MSNILDSFRLDNKVALVTGSAGGMGAAIAIALAQAGAAIATHDIRPPADTVSTIEAAGGTTTELPKPFAVRPPASGNQHQNR